MRKYTEDDLLNLITQTEYNAITQYRKDYNNAEYGHFLDSRELLRPWATAKAVSLIDLFGGKLILEKEIVTNALSPMEKRKKVKESQAINDFVNTVGVKLRELEFINRIVFCNDNDEQFYDVTNLTPVNIYDNKIDYNIVFDFIIYKDINHTEEQGHYKKTFLAGTKATKVFKYISEILNLDELYEKFRVAQSMLHNFKNKVTLCLSIHPLDYMTMSDNTYNWSSCMSWKESGCYRAGTVEMMNSEVVIVAYVKGNDKFYIKDYEWNNKKWRELFVIDFTKEGLISEIKPYPYINGDYVEYILNWIEELGKKNNSITENMTNVVFNESGVADSITLTTDTNLMYNDVLHNSNFNGKLISLPTKSIYRINNFSGKCQCMQCGDINTCEDADAITCPECGGALCWCDNCNYHSSNEDYFYWVNDQQICRDCLDEYYTWSDLEDEYIHNDNLVVLSIQDNGDREEVFDEYTIFNEENIFEDHILHWIKLPEDYCDTYTGIRSFCYDRETCHGIAIYLDELTTNSLNRIFGCKDNLEVQLQKTKNYEGATFTMRAIRYDSHSNHTYVWNGKELIEKTKED